MRRSTAVRTRFIGSQWRAATGDDDAPKVRTRLLTDLTEKCVMQLTYNSCQLFCMIIRC